LRHVPFVAPLGYVKHNHSQEEQLKRAYEKAIAEGRAEGEAKGKTEVIKNLLSLNKFSISDIVELANVTVDFVKRIEADIVKEK